MGVQMDLPTANVRIWRTEDEIKVWDLNHANKRGKHVLLLHFYNLKTLREPLLSWVNEWLLYVGRVSNFHPIYKSAQTLNQRMGGSFLEVRTLKAIQVAPFGFVPIKLENEHFKLKADWETFTVEFEDGQVITPKGKKAVKSFYRWVEKFSEEIEKYDRPDIVTALNAINLKYHPKM